MLDASTLCRFAENGALAELHEYLGERARLTREVERELLRLAERPELSALGDYMDKEGAAARSSGRWPKLTKNPPDHLKADFADLLSLARKLDEHERAHAGEIATVLIAAHRGTRLVVMVGQRLSDAGGWRDLGRRQRLARRVS